MRFVHTSIRASDPVASVAFYELLGLEVIGCLNLDGTYLVYLAAPGTDAPSLEIAIRLDADESYERVAGSGHIAFESDDFDGLLSRLAEAGVAPERAPFRPSDRHDLRVCFVQDPDGVRVELIDGVFATPHDDMPKS